MIDFKEAAALIGRDVVVVNEWHFPGGGAHEADGVHPSPDAGR